MGAPLTSITLFLYKWRPAKARRTVEHVNERESWASSEATRSSMRSNRGRDTKPELAIRRILHARGLRYNVNRRPVRTLRRTADILFPRIKLAVFIDGCFWHGCPEHHTLSKTNTPYWSDKVEANRLRDQETDRLLHEAGWETIRIWEHVPAREAANFIEEQVQARG